MRGRRAAAGGRGGGRRRGGDSSSPPSPRFTTHISALHTPHTALAPPFPPVYSPLSSLSSAYPPHLHVPIPHRLQSLVPHNGQGLAHRVPQAHHACGAGGRVSRQGAAFVGGATAVAHSSAPREPPLGPVKALPTEAPLKNRAPSPLGKGATGPSKASPSHPKGPQAHPTTRNAPRNLPKSCPPVWW